jgi:DNA-binding TFAR19-related protein (PDSD5 family)
MLFAAVTHLVEGLSLEALLTLNVEKSLIWLVGTRRLTVSITEQQLILFLKTLIRNKASRCCRLE